MRYHSAALIALTAYYSKLFKFGIDKQFVGSFKKKAEVEIIKEQPNNTLPTYRSYRTYTLFGTVDDNGAISVNPLKESRYGYEIGAEIKGNNIRRSKDVGESHITIFADGSSGSGYYDNWHGKRGEFRYSRALGDGVRIEVKGSHLKDEHHIGMNDKQLETKWTFTTEIVPH